MIANAHFNSSGDYADFMDAVSVMERGGRRLLWSNCAEEWRTHPVNPDNKSKPEGVSRWIRTLVIEGEL